ncbi:hypothetical protein MVEN_01880100 [Mycena venus]|uniref:Uncharacterized protein n=1 Tax=Mycena venus TaxID=2733690 RepID=A0A8H6XH62_9AGAR|nr:hypothetical protein MVEN_01880100 [Mycena venus]
MVKISSRMLMFVGAATHFSLASAAIGCTLGSGGATCVDGTSTITGPTAGAGPIPTGGVACNLGTGGATCVDGSTTITGATGTGVASASVSCTAGTDGVTCKSGPTVTPPSTSPTPTTSAGEKIGGSALTFVSVGLALAAYQLF